MVTGSVPQQELMWLIMLDPPQFEVDQLKGIQKRFDYDFKLIHESYRIIVLQKDEIKQISDSFL